MTHTGASAAVSGEIVRAESQALVTGHRSGLGRYLVSLDGFMPFKESESGQSIPSQIVVHSGYREPDSLNVEVASQEAERQIRLTRRYIAKSRGLFVFISSVDVYPRSASIKHSETTKIDLRDIRGHHGLLKIYLEHLVKTLAAKYCIIRPSLMLGNFARPNSVSRIMRGDSGPYPLSSESTFALVTHNLVGDFIRKVIHHRLDGVWNLASPDSVSLQEVATLSDNPLVEFGDASYETPAVDTAKAQAILDRPMKSAADTIQEMLSQPSNSGAR